MKSARGDLELDLSAPAEAWSALVAEAAKLERVQLPVALALGSEWEPILSAECLR